jgi:S1-C subfamily serine protease
MFPSTRVGLLPCLLLLTAGLLQAGELSRVEVARKGKEATVLVLATASRSSSFGGRGFGGGGSSLGCAVCIHPSGLFLTEYQVVGGGRPCRITLQPGLKTMKPFTAQVVRADPENNLALLWAPEATNFPALALGSTEGLRQRTEVIICSVSFATETTRFSRGGFRVGTISDPTVALHVNEIGSAPGEAGARDLFTLSKSPEQTGGPVLNRQGQVIGFLPTTSGRGSPARVIAVDRVKEMLKTPLVMVNPPTLSAETQHQSVPFQVRVVEYDRTGRRPGIEVDLVVQLPEGKERRFKLSEKEGLFRTSIVPVPPAKEPPKLRVTVTYPDGSIQGLTPPQTIKLGDKDYPLSSIRTLVNEGKTTSIVFANPSSTGTFRPRDEPELVVNTATSPLPPLVLQVAGKPWRVRLQDARAVSIEPPEPVMALTCTVLARADKTELGRWQQSLPIGQPVPTSSRSGFTRSGDRNISALVNALFDRYAGGKDILNLAALPPNSVRDRLQAYARANGITNGKITRAQFTRFYQDTVNRSRSSRGRDPANPASRFGGRGRQDTNPPPGRFGGPGAPGRNPAGRFGGRGAPGQAPGGRFGGRRGDGGNPAGGFGGRGGFDPRR